MADPHAPAPADASEKLARKVFFLTVAGASAFVTLVFIFVL
jgi:hypothetical protein